MPIWVLTIMQTKSIPYTFVRGGYFYFSRRVPNDLRKYYSYPRVVQGLRTSSPQKAKVQANVAAAKLDAYWSQMRLAETEVLGMSLVKEMPSSYTLVGPSLGASIGSGQVDCLSLLDALKVYLDLKGKGRPKGIVRQTWRPIGWSLIFMNGNIKPIKAF